MSEFNIAVDGGSSVRLLTAGKYCDRDIVVESNGISNDELKQLIDRDITEFKIPDGIQVVGRYMFYDCRKLQTVSFPTKVTSILTNAFADCRELTLASLPKITLIEGAAFKNCAKLAITRLPDTLRFTYGDVFYGCTGITEITFERKPTTLSSLTFSGCPNLTTINVPWAEGEVADAPWGATNATINYDYTEG